MRIIAPRHEMNRDRDLRNLETGSAHDRLLAARHLLRSAEREDLSKIEEALSRENVLWTRTALQDIVERLRSAHDSQTVANDKGSSPPWNGVLSAVTDEYLNDLHANAVRETTSLLLHEIEPVLGVLSVYANKEVMGYEASKSKVQIDRLNDLLGTIAELRRVSMAPSMGEVELSSLINQICNAETTGKTVQVHLAGPTPFGIMGDHARIWIAVTNGLRNAIESTLSVPTEVQHPIVINWHQTPHEYWIAILDSGLGIRSNLNRMFDIGSTTKASHLGMGLPTAQQALATLGGSITLTAREPGGAKFEMRWPRYKTEVK